MSHFTIQVTPELHQYLQSVSVRETDLLKALREETAKEELARMQISPEQGQFMALLIKLLGARRTVEVGVFTGYSALCVAAALPDNGQIIACDIDEGWTNIAQRYWQQAGVAHKIDLRLAPALKTLDNLLCEGQQDQFDFAFIDADKENYQNYYERCLTLVRPGGLIAVDNVLWNGNVINPDKQDIDTCAIRTFNGQLLKDERVDISLIPIGDGLTLARKR
ncbi:MAG: class I SAM-dependent methyltransferase [Pseudomonadales bacterium]|nr:class I SAM-dependent methyltransferase [Pseudomonadales bacterium]